jgi:hypothetical protein
MVMVIAAFVDPAEFVTVIGYDAEPAVVGVPLITQNELTERPAGRSEDVQLEMEAPLLLMLDGLMVRAVFTVPEALA